MSMLIEKVTVDMQRDRWSRMPELARDKGTLAPSPISSAAYVWRRSWNRSLLWPAPLKPAFDAATSKPRWAMFG
jgi:hypothetical protein